MKALIIQHETSTPPGSTIKWLELRSLSYDLVFAQDLLSENSYDAYDLIFICGGGMNVDQEILYPWMTLEKKILKRLHLQKKKMIGLCLGSQLLAEMLGAQVKSQLFWEIGWQPVTLENTFQTKKDLMVFQWHGYTFDLPKDATRIASSVACQNQGFTYQDHIMAFQFHPETTLEWALECAYDPELPPRSTYTQTPDEIKRDNIHQSNMEAWYFSTLDSFAMPFKFNG